MKMLKLLSWILEHLNNINSSWKLSSAGLDAHNFNPSTGETEADESLRVECQPRLHSEFQANQTLSQNKNKRKEGRKATERKAVGMLETCRVYLWERMEVKETR